MKNIAILIVSLLMSASVSLMLYLDDHKIADVAGFGWKHKAKESRSRLYAVPILLYHNINGRGPFSINETVLQEHFQLIRDRGMRVIPLKELEKRMGSTGPSFGKAVTITFDDGYYSMYSLLAPLAREYRYPVTLFVHSNGIAHAASKTLTWSRLRVMDRTGLDVQAHSMSHVDLTKLSRKNDQDSRKKLFEEIYLSKRILELYLKKKIDYFAFPFGRYDFYLIEMAHNAGYKRVFSTDYGSNIITRDNFCLRRSHIKSSYSFKHIEDLIK